MKRKFRDARRLGTRALLIEKSLPCVASPLSSCTCRPLCGPWCPHGECPCALGTERARESRDSKLGPGQREGAQQEAASVSSSAADNGAILVVQRKPAMS